MKRWTLPAAALLVLGVVLTQMPAWTQVQPGKAVSTEQLKKLVEASGRKFTVSAEGDLILNVPRPESDNINYRCLLYSYEKGKAVVISCNGFLRGKTFARLKSDPGNDEKAVDELLERINQWNANRSLSRAILTKGSDDAGKKIYYARLEADLDWELGVTDKKVDGLIKQFARSLVEFESFIGTDPLPLEIPAGLPGQEVVHFPLNAKGESAAADSIQASWRVHYSVERAHGLTISGAWFKKKGSKEWFKVLEDVRVSTLYVPYEEGMPRYFDMDIAVAPYKRHAPWAFKQLVAPEQSLIGPYGKKLNDFVVRENRDAGLLWMYTDDFGKEDAKLATPREGKTHVQRRQEMVLWSVFQASNYFYVMQYGFHNDGTVTCRLGSTGQNLHDHGGKGTGHMHNAGWRVHLDLGGSAPDLQKKLADKIDVYRVSHLETPDGKGSATTDEDAVLSESGFDWRAEDFTLVRVRNAAPAGLNELKHPINYDMVSLRLGSARHYAPARDYDETETKEKKLSRPNDDFTHHDFWATNLNKSYTNYENLPTYVKDRKKLAGNPVLWHWSSNLHIPRDEDFTGPDGKMRTKGCAVVMWSGFDLKPRNLFSGTPFLGN